MEKNTTVERPLVHQMTAFYLYYSPLSASFLFVSFARSSSLLPELWYLDKWVDISTEGPFVCLVRSLFQTLEVYWANSLISKWSTSLTAWAHSFLFVSLVRSSSFLRVVILDISTDKTQNQNFSIFSKGGQISFHWCWTLLFIYIILQNYALPRKTIVSKTRKNSNLVKISTFC